MKHFYLMLLAGCLCSCKKYLSEPAYPGIDHNLLQERSATISERSPLGCYPVHVMLKLDQNVKNYYPYYLEDYGTKQTNDDREIWVDLREVWAYNLPDTLYAPGQRLKIQFRTYNQMLWFRCGNLLVPNLIGLQRIVVDYFEDEVEITAVQTRCDSMVEVKVKNTILPYKWYEPVLASNVPDSLKAIGRKFRCTFRFASQKEHKGCKLSVYDTQLVIKDIR